MESTVERDLAMLRACKTDEEREAVTKQLRELHKNDSPETSMENIKDIGERVGALSVEVKLLELQKHGISLAYIATDFLGKSRSYLSQRLHKNRINGNRASLTASEIKKISEGLKIMSAKLQELSASLDV
jgi:hypothetical protein